MVFIAYNLQQARASRSRHALNGMSQGGLVVDSSSHSRWKLSYGPLELDLLVRTLFVDGELRELPPVQFQVLAYLLANRGRSISSNELCHSLLRTPHASTRSSIRNQIAALRRRLEPHGNIIQTRWRVGYSIGMLMEQECGTQSECGTTP